MEETAYKIAEWLAYNADAVSARLKERYPTAGDASSREHALAYIVGEHHPKMTYEDVALAFQDERVRIIMDRYYLKELQ